MARRTIDPDIRARVVQRKLSGESTSAIAVDEGLDPKTVRNYLRDAEDGAAPQFPRRRSAHRAEADRENTDDEDDESGIPDDGEPTIPWIGVLALGGIAVAGIMVAARGKAVLDLPEIPPWRVDLRPPESS